MEAAVSPELLALLKSSQRPETFEFDPGLV